MKFKANKKAERKPICCHRCAWASTRFKEAPCINCLFGRKVASLFYPVYNCGDCKQKKFSCSKSPNQPVQKDQSEI